MTKINLKSIYLKFYLNLPGPSMLIWAMIYCYEPIQQFETPRTPFTNMD